MAMDLTAKEYHHLCDDKWEAEVKAKADEWYKEEA